MTLLKLMEKRKISGSQLADLIGASRQNMHIAFARGSFSKKLAGRIAAALKAECVVKGNGELDFKTKK
jgi:hypothetical protein